MSDTRVDVGECRCPGAPHPNDWVELYPEPTIAMGSAVMAAIRASGDDNMVLQGNMAVSYVLFGIKAWSFIGEDGDPIAINPSHEAWPSVVNKLLPWAHGGKEVVDRADGLYSEAILRPLLSRTSTQSQGGQMDGLTSATPSTSPQPQKQSQPSSPAGMAGKRSVAQGR